MWHWDSNPQPLERESPPITTRPGLPPNTSHFLTSCHYSNDVYKNLGHTSYGLKIGHYKRCSLHQNSTIKINLWGNLFSDRPQGHVQRKPRQRQGQQQLRPRSTLISFRTTPPCLELGKDVKDLTIDDEYKIYFKWANPGLFFAYFWCFQTNNTIFATNRCEKNVMSIQ